MPELVHWYQLPHLRPERVEKLRTAQGSHNPPSSHPPKRCRSPSPNAADRARDRMERVERWTAAANKMSRLTVEVRPPPCRLMPNPVEEAGWLLQRGGAIRADWNFEFLFPFDRDSWEHVSQRS